MAPKTESSKLDKLLEDIKQLTVLELAELVKSLEDEFGLPAGQMAMPVMPGAAGPAAEQQAEAPKVEEKAEYKVELVEGGPDKIKTIKAVRQAVKDMGLTEAKQAVENVPTVLIESASKEDAQKIKEILEGAGAKIKLS